MVMLSLFWVRAIQRLRLPYIVLENKFPPISLRGGFSGAKTQDFYRNFGKKSRVSIRSRPFPDPNLELDVPNLFAILQFQRWIWNDSVTNDIIQASTFKVSQSATSSANTNLMKDKNQRRLAHARRHNSHEENAPVVAVAAWAFVVVISVTVARPLQKPAEFRAS